LSGDQIHQPVNISRQTSFGARSGQTVDGWKAA
jgi:hypothetical protein